MARRLPYEQEKAQKETDKEIHDEGNPRNSKRRRHISCDHHEQRKKKKLLGSHNTEETIEGTMECQRAIIEVTPLQSDEEQVKTGRIML